LLKRVAELTDVVLTQSQEVTLIKTELAECRSEIAALKVNKDRTDMFKFGGGVGSTFSGACQAPTRLLGGVSATPGPLFDDKESRGGSRSVKRKRQADDRPGVIVGSASVSEGIIPAVKRVFKKRVFVSRVAPEVSAETLHKAIRPKLKAPLSVVRLHTQHASYSSFCLFVEDEDEATVLAPSLWASGTLIKSFFGRLDAEKIHSRYDEPGLTRTPFTAAGNASLQNGKDPSMEC